MQTTTTVGRILGNVLLLGLAVAALLGVCELLARCLLPPTNFAQKLAAMERCRNDIEVAVVGSSRAARGLDVRVMPWPAYNFADNAQSPNFHAQIVLRQAERLPRLRAAIVVLDEFAFGSDDAAMGSADYVLHGYTLMHPKRSDWLSTHSQLFRFRRQFLPHMLGVVLRDPGHVTPVSDGDQPADTKLPCLLARCGFIWSPPITSGLSVEECKRWAEVRREVYRPELRAQVVSLLRSFLQAARARNLKVALLEPPLHANYRRFVDAGMLTDYQNGMAALMQNQPPAQVCFRSYYADPRFGDAEFSDSDHLNCNGALRWAQIVSQDLSAFIGSAATAQL